MPRPTVAPSVEAFLAAVPPPARAALERLREVLRQELPQAEEVINYGVPMFKVGGKGVVSYGAGKSHCSFYVQSPAVMEAHATELAGYKTSKGTVHFQADTPLPEALVRKLVRARLAEMATIRKQSTKQ